MRLKGLIENGDSCLRRNDVTNGYCSSILKLLTNFGHHPITIGSLERSEQGISLNQLEIPAFARIWSGKQE